MFGSWFTPPSVVFCDTPVLTRPTMPADMGGDPPLLQRLYDRIWLLAVVAILIWAVTYVLWGYVDIWTIPPAPGVVA